MDPLPPATALILQRLKEHSDTYLSGSALAAELSMTRTGVWKHIRVLAARGYAIERQPRLGYRLASCPDLLLPEEILPQLRTLWLGKTYVHHLETGSTNDDALALALRGTAHGTVVVAERQRVGRGRLRRAWDSPMGLGLYVSLLFTRPLPAPQALQCPLVIALALVRTLHARFALEALVKWPNDILIHGRKAAGILAEMQLDQDEARTLVVGVGVNVNQDESEFEGEFRVRPTSLALELQRTVPRSEVLTAFLEEAERVFDRFSTEGFRAFLEEFEAMSAIVGATVTVVAGSKAVSGVVRGFTPEGAMRLLPDGAHAEEVIWVGDVSRVSGDFAS